jgi:hypothetical protein
MHGVLPVLSAWAVGGEAVTTNGQPLLGRAHPRISVFLTPEKILFLLFIPTQVFIFYATHTFPYE